MIATKKIKTFLFLLLSPICLFAQITKKVDVSFVVKDINDNPISEAQVSYKEKNADYYTELGELGITNEEGFIKGKINSNAKYTFKVSAKTQNKSELFKTESIVKGEDYNFKITLLDNVSNISGFVYEKDNSNAPISGVLIKVFDKENMGGEFYSDTSGLDGGFSLGTLIKPNTPIIIRFQKGANYNITEFDTLSRAQLYFEEKIYLERTNRRTILTGEISEFDQESIEYKGKNIPLIISDIMGIKSFSIKPNEQGKFRVITNFKKGDKIKVSLIKNPLYVLTENSKRNHVITQFDEFDLGSLVLERKKRYVTGKTLIKRKPESNISLLASIKRSKDWKELPKMITNKDGIYQDTREGFIELPKKVRFKLDEPAKDRISLMKPFIKHEYIFWWKNRYDSKVNLNIRKNKIYNQRKWWITGGLALAGLGFTINKSNKFDKYAKNPKNDLLYNKAEKSQKTANRFFEATFLSIGFNLAIKTQITRTVRLSKNNSKKQ